MPGARVGLVGESGCGKSTLGLSIMRLLPANGRIAGGHVWFDGRDLASLSEREMAQVRTRKIAMIFQDPLASLNPTMPVGRQIAEAMEVHLDLSREKAARHTTELLEMVGIQSPRERVHDFPHQFSGGMRQRVMIAMAISCDPVALIADEPTTALDVTVQAQVLDLVRRLTDERHMALILVTHDIGVVMETCQEVIVMYAGKIVEKGELRAVFGRPTHPYTMGLLESSLTLAHDRQQPLLAIPGMPPDLVNPSSGCAFAPRCSRRGEICDQQMPPLFYGPDNRLVACWIDTVAGVQRFPEAPQWRPDQ